MSRQTLQAVNMYRKPRRAGLPTFTRPDEWLVLGHFDTLTLDEPPCSGSALSAIWEDVCRQPPSGDPADPPPYRHSTYLLDGRAGGLSQPKKGGPGGFAGFRGEEAPFLMFTRLHAVAREDAGTDKLETALNEILERYPDIPYYYAKTLELSDLILLVKFRSVPRLLELLERLSDHSAVGDAYTCLCISQAALLGGEDLADAREPIGLASLRFAVKGSMEQARAQVKAWEALEVDGRRLSENDSFFVTGTEDVNLLVLGITSRGLVQLLRGVILDSSLWAIFDDMTTRLGKRFSGETAHAREGAGEDPRDGARKNGEGARGDPPSGGARRLREAYHFLRGSLLNWKNGQDWEREPNWFRPLLQILSTLESVSENCMLNQLCYVLLDGFHGLMEKLPGGAPLLPDVQLYVDGMAYLTEHMIRMESQLIHHPETRPLLFHIPASVMELDLAFADLCADYLQMEDEKQRRFYFSIVPVLQNKLGIKNLIHEEGDAAYLLYLSIPLESCCDPGLIVRVLVHEIAHFSGETARFRKERRNSMVRICAYLLCQHLGIQHSSRGLRALAVRLKQVLKQNAPDTGYLIMADLTPALQRACRMVFRDEEFIFRLLRAASQEPDCPISSDGTGEPRREEAARLQWLDGVMERYRSQRNQDKIETTASTLVEVEMLLRECYADIAMIQLLDLTEQDYFRLTNHVYLSVENPLPKGELARRNREGQELFQKAVFIQRMALVIMVSYYSGGRPGAYLPGGPEETAEPLSRWIAAYCREFRKNALQDLRNVAPEGETPLTDSDGTSCFVDLRIAYDIYQYLYRCRNKMLDISRAHPKERENIQALYRTITEDGQYMSALQIEHISRFRRKMLDKLQQEKERSQGPGSPERAGAGSSESTAESGLKHAGTPS